MNTLARKVSMVALILASACTAYAQDQKVDFAKDIKPIFDQSCIKCHGLDPKNQRRRPAAKLRLDDEALAMAGGRSGKAIIPGDTKDSLLFKLLNGPVPRPASAAGMDDDKNIAPMPHAKRGQKWKPLPKQEIDLIAAWINQGAVWPKS